METIDTAEPDEFARLLAQLNGEPDPAAAAPVEANGPTVPAAPLLPPAAEPDSAAPAAPLLPPPAAPLLPPPSAAPPAAPPTFPPPAAIPGSTPPAAPLVSPEAAPLMAPEAPPVAPAFGLATPVPALVVPAAVPAPAAPPSVGPPSITFPSVATPSSSAPAAPPPVFPPVTLAPELMGADELAAPPSATSAPPVEPDAPPSMVPLSPAAGTPLAAAGTPLAAAATPLAAALADAPPPLASASVSSALAPTAEAAPPPAAAPPAAAPLARSGPTVDFSALLSTKVGADDVPSSASAPLAFGAGSTEVSDDEPDIGRSTLFEKIGLVLAILVAPLGLILGIVSAILSARRRGWVIGIVRATIAIAAVLTVVLGIAGYYQYTQLQQQLHHDQIAADSAAFCSTLKANPSMYQPPTFGWPAVAASIPDSLTAMQAFEDRWTKLAKVSPAGIKGDVTKEAAAAKQIIDSVTVSRVVNDASNVAVMSSVASSSGIPAWHSAYCG